MNISDWIPFEITEADWKQAKKLAIETREKARELGLEPIFQTEKALQNEIVGIIGERKFEVHLITCKIPYEKDRPIGRPDKFDFEIEGKIYSVKTNLNDWHPSRSPYNYKFLVNKSQFYKREAVAYYVSMMVYKNKVWFCGLISRAEVSTHPISNPGYAPCYNILYSELLPPQNLIKTVFEAAERQSMR